MRSTGPGAGERWPTPRAVAHIVDEVVNDLEPAAEMIAPELREFRRRLESVAGQPALLAGSGSAYWIPVADAEEAATHRGARQRRVEDRDVRGNALRVPSA